MCVFARPETASETSVKIMKKTAHETLFLRLRNANHTILLQPRRTVARLFSSAFFHALEIYSKFAFKHVN